MPTLQVYLDEATNARWTRIAEAKATSGSNLIKIVVANLVTLDAAGRTLRRRLHLPEP